MRRQGSEKLRIEISQLNGKIITKWFGSDGESVRIVPTQVSQIQLAKLRKNFAISLQAIKDSLGHELEQSSWLKIRKTVKALHENGETFAWHLFGGARQSINNLFRKYCVGWNNKNSPVPIIAICSQTENLVPFEFFPCLSNPSNSDSFKRINNLKTLEKCLEGFIGFSCIIKRSGESGEPGARAFCEADILFSNPKLPMKLFVCRLLKGVILEEQQFQKLKHHLNIDTWPKKGWRGTVNQLANFLWKTSHATNAKAKTIPDQIHHFSSHYTAKDEDSDNHFFTLAGCKKSEFSATLGDLHIAFGRLSRTTLPAINQRPLVFVNACDSSIVFPDQISSLPDLFLNKLRSRGYLGTETTISDSVAVEFSYQFYNRLLQGAQLGETLHDTRWWLIRRYRNPLGLFYTCYANPELHVSHPCSISKNEYEKTEN
jgi:CHAT domain-containing protein